MKSTKDNQPPRSQLELLEMVQDIYPDFDELTIGFYSCQSRLDLMIGAYYQDGSGEAEFAIEWVTLGLEAVPRLGVFNDAWLLFSKLSPALLPVLEDFDNCTASRDKVMKRLIQAGFVHIGEVP